jgi:hypothetical protein
MRWCVSLIMRLMRRRVEELQSCVGLAGAIHTAEWVSRLGLANERTHQVEMAATWYAIYAIRE